MATNTIETDLVVIGAGPGGYAAAFAAADRGIKTVLVDADERPGGVCLNRGCIPSKTLLHAARIIAETHEAKAMGLTFGEPKIDLDALRKWKNDVIAKNANGVRQLAKSRGVQIVRAWARFENSTTLLLSSQPGGEPDQGRLTYRHAILATGSLPARIPAFDIGSPRVIDSTGALDLPDIPKSLLVIGGGYIGLEMGTVYAALGSEVTVVEMTDGLLPGADRDLVRVLANRLKKDFKNIYLSTKVTRLEDTLKSVRVHFEKADNATGSAPPPTEFDRVLVAVGRTPNSKNLGLENTRVKVTQRGFVEIDNQCRTADEYILAIGDVAGEPMLAHKAHYEAVIAVEVIAGVKGAAKDARAIPAVVFTDPEIAWAGLTETQAAQQGIAVEVAKFPWGASGRATAIGRNDGLTKFIVAPESKRILGVGIVGVNAGELIAEGTLAIEMGATAADVGMTIHAHPTLAETFMEGAEIAATGSTTHIYRPPR
ncbi:MAG TPA: dihydrolipoyl dehydrogenase [Phycisphaerae bacterium]|jgi:dihydrolipoamide dehydrogenase|nr:dihydrolipoyl dehydrogenase [Phycisphaerae bacterium]HOB75955.1 dihydrolipoyl dehydrogenase [Phycisphaerae bacterium]HOJ55561.1 dihydrolipoyl dehydrogenase [Phycisphaerae bacterium]HOL27593.1 dihydrolipoyl dehydrogenase [Phycisphaerae bacterium]HPP21835.1 dihydrolipoyl dehydrogenase [Phycisphaerae bacterium]